MNFFIFLSWFSCISTAVILAIIFLKRKYWYFRPSLQIVLWFNLMIQWGGAFLSKNIYNFLPLPWHFFFVTYMIPFLVLLYNLAMGDLWVKDIWNKTKEPITVHRKELFRLLWLLLFIIVFINIYFFYKVPFKSTGIYSLFTDPLATNIIREGNLKLISDSFFRYGYSIVRSGIAPLLAAIMVILFSSRKQQKSWNFAYTWLFFALFLYIFLVVALPGARGGPAGLVFCILVALYIYKGMPIKTRYVVIGLISVLFLPVVMTIMREGQSISLNSLFEFFSYLFKRLFVSPMEVGLWHMHYAQINGFVGVEGVRPLALFFGREYISLPNIVGLAYMENPLKTVSADTGFFFDYYACFGLFTLTLSVILTMVLDFILPLLKRCDFFLIPLLAFTFYKTINFAESAYTVTFITHGFILIPLLAILTSLSVRKIRFREDSQKAFLSIKY